MINDVTHIYFLGIGGIGMSALARYFHDRGVSVCGYDRNTSDITRKLEQEGIQVSYADDPATLPVEPQLVVYTPAVPKKTALFQHFTNQRIPIRKRAEVLGLLSDGIPTVAVAGTHGKTTISAMLTHILKTAGVPCLAFLGGISVNYGTNFIGDRNPRWMVAEADEFDRSFLHLTPEIALISSIDRDHSDIYGSHGEMVGAFKQFASRLPDSGVLISKKDIAGLPGGSYRRLEYHGQQVSDYYLQHIRVSRGRYEASIMGELHIDEVVLQHPGRHNLENALAAAALAHQAGVDPMFIKSGLESFAGVKRRFEVCLKTEDTVYVDDYAHHPEEIRACIRSARELWPGKKITGVFQPHLYSRTQDLAKDFATSLAELDELILLDIYPAREEPIPGINAWYLLDMIDMKHAQYCRREHLLSLIQDMETEVLITMGAGDIDRFAVPITNTLKNKGDHTHG